MGFGWIWGYPLVFPGVDPSGTQVDASGLSLLAQQVEDSLLALGLQDNENSDGLQEWVPWSQKCSILNATKSAQFRIAQW